MFFLKFLLSLLILPPMNLALALFVGFLLLCARPRLGRWIVGVASVLLLVLGMPLIGDNLMLALEQGLPLTPPADAPPGAIVILSGDMRDTAGSPPGFDVGPLTLERMRAGAALYRRTHLPVLTSGGKLNPDAPPISVVMAEAMQQDFAVPVRWTETHSRDTWENAQDSAAILRAAGITSVYVVTHAWHERRALIAFRHAGLAATAAPARLDRFPARFPGELVPRTSVWLRSFYALHEWVGCAWYSLP